MTLRRGAHLSQTLVTEPRGEDALSGRDCVHRAAGGDSGVARIPDSNKTHHSVGPFVKWSSRVNHGVFRFLKDPRRLLPTSTKWRLGAKRR